jgi:hypothetical protein
MPKVPKTKRSKICKLYYKKTSRNLLQDEFDVCVRLDEEWMKFDRMTMEMYSKSYCWSMVKWNKVAFVDVNCMVWCLIDISFWLKSCAAAKVEIYLFIVHVIQAVKNCDQIFRTESNFAKLEKRWDSVFVCKPSSQIWGKMKEALWMSIKHG